MIKNTATKILLVIGLVFILVALVYWNEARKEIVYLCGNFGKGVSEQSALEQLDTGNFLRYSRNALSSGSRIEVDSSFYFAFYRCTIDFDLDGKVVNARVE